MPLPNVAWALTMILPCILFWFVKASVEDNLLRRGLGVAVGKSNRWSSPHFEKRSTKLSNRVATEVERSIQSEQWARSVATAVYTKNTQSSIDFDSEASDDNY